MVSAARTEGPGVISRELVLPPQRFEAAEQTPVSELKEHRADWFALSCPHRLYRSLQPEGTQQVEVDGYEGDSWEKALFGKGRQVPGERKGLAPLGQGWLIWSRGQTTASHAWPCPLEGEGLDSFPEVSAGTHLCSALTANPLGILFQTLPLSAMPQALCWKRRWTWTSVDWE